MPVHIQDIFENELLADFRMVGATTRQPHEIPAAIRSRYLEVFFRPLVSDEVARIATAAVAKMGVALECHTKIKAPDRLSYGFRNRDRFRQKMLLGFLPETAIPQLLT